MTTWSLAIVCFEAMILCFQLINWLSRPQQKERLRFLILTVLFIIYTISNSIIPDVNNWIPMIIQYTISYSTGIILATYYFYFLLVQMDIRFGLLFNPKILLFSLAVTFSFGYLLTFHLTNDDQLARYIFLGFPSAIALYFCVETIRRLITNKASHKTSGSLYVISYYASYFGIIFMALMPVLVFFGYLQFWSLTIVNISFLLTGTAYLLRHIIISRMESEWLKNSGFNTSINLIVLRRSGLSEREMEVAHMLFNESEDFSSISEKLFISKNTCTKHASNIYKKTGVANRKEFIDLVSKPSM
jgi:DNA-binding CsgD family transcriptional regulator